MSRTVLAKVEGFTPVIDSIVKDTGSYVTALVFGRMWRFCQMKDGVCNATLETIADGLGMSRQTIINHAKKLIETGYLIDKTPGLRNKPHTYVDTGKACLHVGVSAGIDVHLVDVENKDVNLIDSDVNVVDSDVHLVDLKKVVKKEKETSTGIIFTTFENNIEMLNPILAEKIGDAIDTYPHQWILDAIEQSVTYGARNWKYIEKILKTWKAKGRANDMPLDKMSDVDKELLRMDIKPAHQVIEEMGLNDVSDEEQKIKNQKILEERGLWFEGDKK